MKKLIYTITVLLFLGLGGLSYGADTNAVSTTDSTNAVVAATNTAPEFNNVDLTFGAAGTTIKGNTDVGVDVSVSIDPFKQAPDLWVGVSQSLYWQPVFAGSTDFDADWIFQVHGNLYVNTGWSVGNVYGQGSDFYRTGPEVIFQYYTSDNAYLYAGVNYDIIWGGDDTDSDGFRYSAGIGLEF